MGYNPTRPFKARPADKFVLAILQQVAAALELPVELIIKHFTASYSASRAALLEAFKFFKARRVWLAAGFCQPCYEDVITEFVARGILTAPGFFDDPVLRKAWLGAEWVGPAAGQLDPKKEIEAAEKRIAIGISTRKRETAELTGGDWEQVNEQLIKEKKVRDAGGLGAPPPPPAGAEGPPALPPPDEDEDPDAEDRRAMEDQE